MASFLSHAVFEELVEHTAIKQRPEWHAKAMKAGELLYELYQDIGAEHL